MKILMIIAKQGFRDEEYQVPYNHFKSKGIAVDIASTESGDCFGKAGTIVAADISLKEAHISDYFAVVLVGGPGSHRLVGNKELEKVLEQAKKQNIVIAAICYAPVILAKAGLLKNKKATVWDDEEKLPSSILKTMGAEHLDEDVVRDGLTITAKDYKASKRFAEKIVESAECEGCWIR
jgi:protease I